MKKSDKYDRFFSIFIPVCLTVGILMIGLMFFIPALAASHHINDILAQVEEPDPAVQEAEKEEVQDKPYVILRAAQAEDMENKVASLIEKGYIPLGGVASTKSSISFYIQAMVKPDIL